MNCYRAVYFTFCKCFYDLENPGAYLKTFQSALQNNQKGHSFLKTIYIITNRSSVTQTTQEYIYIYIGSRLTDSFGYLNGLYKPASHL